MKTAALLLLFVSLGAAQEMHRMDTWERAWVASSAAFVGAQVADAATSYGNVGREQNPLFGSTFTAKDAAIKLGVTAGIITAQYLVLRKYPNTRAARLFALVNFGAAGVTGAVAARNHRRNQ